MAMQYVPGLNVPVKAAQTLADISKVAIGEDNYNNIRNDITLIEGARVGFLPTTPLWIPFQFGFILIVSLILIFAFKVNWAKAIFSSYIIQALILTFFISKLSSLFYTYGIGI